MINRTDDKRGEMETHCKNAREKVEENKKNMKKNNKNN